jgi:hypothetical protein
MPGEHAELFPYFEGYCGSPNSALALLQQCGAVRNVASYHHQVSGKPLKISIVINTGANSIVAVNLR